MRIASRTRSALRTARPRELTAELVEGLRRLDPARVDAGLIIAMGGDHPAAEQMRTIVREWRDGGQLGEIQQNAADEVLGGGGD